MQVHRIRRTAVVFAALAAGGATAAVPALATPVQAVFPFSGGPQTWTVPTGVTQATFTLQGAAGGIGSPGGVPAAGGLGASVRATLPVTPGQTYALVVGGAGGSGLPGGYNGGGAAGGSLFVPEAGSGGGATDLRRGGAGAPLSARVLVAAGGGGGGSSGATSAINGAGGAGGAALQDGAGGAAAGTSGAGGGGTTLGAGGTLGSGPTPGAPGGAALGSVGGAGAAQPAASAGGNGGGGGGGWSGGGGGGAGSSDGAGSGAGGGGGAGGQSHVDATLAQQVAIGLAAQPSDGVAVVSYEPLDAPAIGTQPTLSGVAAVGRQLTCELGTWSGAPALEVAWLRNGTAIEGATTAQYTLVAADGGQQLACRVTATNTLGSAVARTPAVVVAAIVAPVLGNAVPPGVTGTAAIGRRLTCAPGVWSGGPAFAYAWLRNGIAIAGARQSTYAAAKADAGQVLQCAVRATANGVAAVAQSAGVGGPPRLVLLATTALVSRTGRVTVPVGCFGPSACRVPAVTVSTGGRAIARAAARTVNAGATAKIALTLGNAPRRRLARAGSALTVRVVATPTGGVGANARAQFVALRGAGLR